MRSTITLSAIAGLTLSVVLAFSALVPSAALGYSDVSAGAPESAAVERLTNDGVLEGYADGTFRPSQPMTRAEFLKALLLATGHTQISSTATTCFVDFRGDNQWYWRYACEAKRLGIISGYPDGTFRGWKEPNLAEALKIAVISTGHPVPVYIRAPDHWYDPYVDASASTGIFGLINTDPAHLVTRGEMAIIIDAFTGGSRQSSSSSSLRMLVP